jgi:putative membrane-bound dehydrogenase-like protein
MRPYLLGCALLLAAASAALGQKTVTHAGKPVTTSPCPTPDEARARMKVPAGFEVRLFAAEPDVVNPVAMTFDPKGRLWVVEMYEYPLGVKKGAKGRDRILILEDTDGDGRADKRTVWYEGLNMPCGIAYGRYGDRAGVFVGSNPDFLFIPENDDGTAGTPRTIRTGFGAQDTHELLNGFTWGPDARLYMTHGVFTHSYVKDPNDPDDDGVRINAAVVRYDPRSNKFEQFADGMSNQWGVDFDAEGQAFVSACVIDHLFHVAPGGIYVRQAGTPGFPYGYELLRSIVKHKHQKAAYCYIACLQNGHWPAEYQQTLVMGNIHGHCLNRDKPAKKGSSYFATDAGDFLDAQDGWFMPVNLQMGPDGELWVADWCDKYPCYQNARADPAGVDREKGRIWRVVYVGDQPGKKVPAKPEGMGDLAKLPDAELIRLLEHPNVWQRRLATRLLRERGVKPDAGLQKAFAEAKTRDARLAAFWAVASAAGADVTSAVPCADHADPAVRAAMARALGETARPADHAVALLVKLAGDPEPTVRREASHALRRLNPNAADTAKAVAALLARPDTADDPMLPFFIWMAAEPQAARDAKPLLAEVAKLEWNNPAVPHFVKRVMRRLCDTGKPERLDEAVAFLEELPLSQMGAARAAFEGLLEGMKGKKIRPARSPSAALAKWRQTPHNGFGGLATQLGSIWGDVSATESVLAVINDAAASESDRVAGIRTARQLKTDPARAALLKALAGETRETVAIELLRALGDVGGDAVAPAVLGKWASLSAESRRVAADVLAGRPAWALALLTAVEDKAVARGDIPLPALRTLASYDDKLVKDRVTAVLGRTKPVGAAYAKLIADKKAVVINGPADYAVGKAMAAKHCLTCHKLHGQGAEVGPDLTGVGRSTLDALLANVLNPNEVIGKGYEQVIVRTTDERTIAGRLIEDTAAHVKILSAGPKEDVVAKGDIDAMKVTELSVMPEGLEKQMTDAEFRSLIWYVLAPPEDQDKKLRIEPGDKQLTVRAVLPGKPEPVELLRYVADPELRPYLHPVRDPSATHVLTDDKPGDHPWQHGIFTGLHKVGTGSVDFWSEKTGRQKFVKLLDLQQGTDRVGWRSLTEWAAPTGEKLLHEEQAVTVYAGTADRYVMDYEWTLRSAGPTVPVGRHDYGGLSVRLKLHPKHSHLNAAGKVGKAAANQKAAWCNVSAPFGDEVFGVTVIEHPSNFRFPNAWRVDGQGMISPSPSLGGDWLIGAKKEMTFRYRIVVHRGPGDPAALSAEADRFAAVP